MVAKYEQQRIVNAEEIDGQNHVNNVVYLKWMQDASVAHSTHQGWSNQRYRDEGVGWVVRSHFIEYLKEAFVDEEILVKTWIANIKKVTSLRKYEISRPSDGSILAKSETNFAFVNRETGKLTRVPPEFTSCFEVVTDEE